MTSEYIEERNGGYYIKGIRISLDSVVYGYKRGESPETIQDNFPFLKLWQVYGAIAFYLENREAIDKYLEESDRKFNESGVPLNVWNPALYERLERARQAMGMKKP